MSFLGFDNSILCAQNVNFNPGATPNIGQVTTNGQLLIGSTVPPNIRVGTLSSSNASIVITNGAGTIDLIAGGSLAISLTPDTGGPVAAVGGTIPTLGYKASTTPVMQTYADGSNFRIADQTYSTQYVVDASTTPGLKGTFQTIQAAITQAVADGTASGANIANIYIRPGTYAGNFTISANNFTFTGISFDQKAQSKNVKISGTITFTSGCLAIFDRIQFSAAQTIAVGASAFFQACSATALITSNASGTQFFGCNLPVGYTGTVGGEIFDSCTALSSGTFTLSGASSRTFINTTEINAALTTATAIFENCPNVLVSGNAGSTITLLNSSLATITAFAGTIYFANVSDFVITQSQAASGFFGSPSIPKLLPSSQGNVLMRRTISASDTVLKEDYYIGVDTVTAAGTVTVTLKTANATTGSPIRDQVYRIVDETGNASVRNIVLTPTNSRTINGQTTYTISQNYGSVDVLFNGTDYVVITARSQDGGSNSGITNVSLLRNDSNTASSAALQNITVGGTSAGDPFQTFTVAGTTNWSHGIDNSVTADPYVLAASTSLGTTNVMTAQTAGQINMPLQPAFLAYVTTTITNVTGDGTVYTVIPDTEAYDIGGNFTLASGTFTAPVAGKYHFDYSMSLGGGTVISGPQMSIVTTALTYQRALNANVGVVTSAGGNIQVIANMAANDTATFTVSATDSGGKIDDVNGLNSGALRTWISGYLVC